MAEIAFSCPFCGHGYQLDASLAGKRARCKVCKEVSRVPAPPTPNQSSEDEPQLRFPCPRCGHGFTLAASLAGKRARCKKCGEVFRVPVRSRVEEEQPIPVAPAAKDPGAGYSLVETEPALMSNSLRLRPKSLPAPPNGGGDEGYWEADDSPSGPGTMPREPSRKKNAASSPLKSWLGYRAKVAVLAVAVVLLMGVFATLLPRAWESGRALFGGDQENPNELPTDPAGDRDLDLPDIPPDRIEVVEAHEQALEEMAKAFVEMVQGCITMRNFPGRFAAGQKEVAQAFEKLDQSARKGASLAKLDPAEKLVLSDIVNIRLKQYAARAAQELNQLRQTPGAESEFDKMLEAINQFRRQFDREFGNDVHRPSVLLIFRKIDDPVEREIISEKAWSLVDHTKSGGMGWRNEVETSRLKVTPVLSARAYADRITFGKVRKITGRRIELDVEPPTAEEVAAFRAKRPPR
jgi:transcription elongation factor Elf1